MRRNRMKNFKQVFLGVVLSFFLASPVLAAGKAVLDWDANTEPDLAGYKVYFGTASKTYGAPIDVGKVTTKTIEPLADGTYFFAVTAYDTSGNESLFSDEVSKTIDSTPPAKPNGLKVLIEKILAFLNKLFNG